LYDKHKSITYNFNSYFILRVQPSPFPSLITKYLFRVKIAPFSSWIQYVLE
jgi:hypothetical protein